MISAGLFELLMVLTIHTLEILGLSDEARQLLGQYDGVSRNATRLTATSVF